MDLTKEKSFISIAKYALVILLGSLLLIISARIQTPFVPVPATMQTFAVLFLGIAFSYKIAVLSVIIYLVEGALGLPVFAGGGGLIYFQGPTSGYLFGFILGALVSGYFKYSSDPILNFIKLLFSVTFIYICGLVWLWVSLNFYSDNNLNFYQIFEKGAKPFLIIETYKILILCVLSKQIYKLRKII
tara:strand:- start:447 stop:1007 length:561 start_codon:yes stop_codon:yes gene_type:complete